MRVKTKDLIENYNFYINYNDENPYQTSLVPKTLYSLDELAYKQKVSYHEILQLAKKCNLTLYYRINKNITDISNMEIPFIDKKDRRILIEALGD